jgi:transcriptional regulator
MSLYNPRYFATADEQAIRRVLTEYGFATLITSARNEVVVSHVPVLFEPDSGAHGSVIGHVARANPHAAALAQGASFLVFQGPFGYVSPTWYTDPAGSVPTWNYVAIHVHGSVESRDGTQDKRGIVDALAARHEASFPLPWTSAKMDPSLLEKMLGAIVGFRMVVERIDAKFKLSQNRSNEDRAGVIAGLEGRGTAEPASLAAWMREYAKP